MREHIVGSIGGRAQGLREGIVVRGMMCNVI